MDRRAVGAAAVLLACCGVGAAIAVPILREYPATVEAPAQMAGFAKIPDQDAVEVTRSLTAKLKKDTGADNAVVGLYVAGADRSRGVLALAVSTLLLSPAKEVASAFGGMDNTGVPVTGVKDYPTGSLGGTVRCGVGTADGLDLSVCVWADHGSLGIGMFYNRDVHESADLFVTMREEMVKRG